MISQVGLQVDLGTLGPELLTHLGHARLGVLTLTGSGGCGRLRLRVVADLLRAMRDT